MEKLYIALVDGTGIFASIIKKAIKLEYCHVVLSLDKDFTKAYSFNRRNPSIPLIAGFVHENTQKILRAFPDTTYKIISISCTNEQKENIRQELEKYYKKRFRYHYCIIGLPFILWNKPFYQKNHYTCSSFTAKLLSENDLHLFAKHFSLVTPKDFFELQEAQVEYEGKLYDYIKNEDISENVRGNKPILKRLISILDN